MARERTKVRLVPFSSPADVVIYIQERNDGGGDGLLELRHAVAEGKLPDGPMRIVKTHIARVDRELAETARKVATEQRAVEVDAAVRSADAAEVSAGHARDSAKSAREAVKWARVMGLITLAALAVAAWPHTPWAK